MEHKFKFILLTIVLLTFSGYAQNKNITGVVTDDANIPLPGVNVIIKGTTTGVVTDFNGQYSISAEAGDTLSFFYVGFKNQDILVGNSNTYNVTMISDSTLLDEVILVGYGTQKKSDVTGSVVSIDQEDIASSPRVSLEQMLQGKAAGLNITVNRSNAEGSSNSLNIRGQNSISASNNPLIIFDGVPYSGNFSELNPNDIASIEVLKDASSTAIYGARGANGVILVSSKRGKSGELSVNYRANYAIDEVINVPRLMDGATFFEAKLERGISTTAIEDDGFAEGRSTDWVDLATQQGIRQDHNLSISGGNDNTNFFVSLSAVDSKGVAINDEFNRYTLRLNLDQKLLPWATFATSTQYGYYDRSGNDADFGDAFRLNPLGIPFNEDGSIRMLTWEDQNFGENPLLPTLEIDNDITRRFISNNSITLDFPFLEGLSFKFNSGYDFRSRLQQTFSGRNTFDGLRDNGRSRVSNGYNEDWLIENILSYKQKFGKHNIFLTALYSAQSEVSQGHDIDSEGFPNDVGTFFQSANAALVEPDDFFVKETHISQMFRANYGFDDRYLATFTIRRDGYSAFGEDTKFGVFSSAALGWNIAKEQFMSDIKKINVLKLRLSYGENGNEAVAPFSTLPSLSSRNYVDADDQTLFGFFPNSLGDATLGWESTSTFNVGLDFGLFNNRLTGSIDSYWSTTTDLLLRKSISDVNGIGSIVQNVGETSNNGIEFQLSSINIDRGGFKWTTNFNISHYDTEIVDVGLTDDEGNIIDDIGNRWFIGEPVNVNFDYVFGGIYQEDQNDTPQGDVDAGDIRYVDTNGDGRISADDRQVIGRRIPDFTTAMINTFEYKGWSLSIFLNAVSGITKRNELLSTNDNDLRRNRFDVEFWTPENNSNVYPRNDATSDINPFEMDFYQSADFIRLQDVTLSYTLPKVFVNKYKLDNVRLFASGRNLATWTDWDGLDPEFSNQRAVPQTSTILFGINIGIN